MHFFLIYMYLVVYRWGFLPLRSQLLPFQTRSSSSLYFGLSEGAGWLKELTSFCRPCFLLPISRLNLFWFEITSKSCSFPPCVDIFSCVFRPSGVAFSQSSGAQDGFNKGVHICFYGNSAFPGPLRTKGLSFNVHQTQRLRYV